MKKSLDRNLPRKTRSGPQQGREECRMDQKIIELYDDFTHRHLDRRLFSSK